MTAIKADIAYKSIEVQREGAIDWLTLNRPDRLNAMDSYMVEELCGYFADLASDEECRVVIMRGAGRGFCSGLDLKSFDPDAPNHLSIVLPNLIRSMRACPQPIIALMRGPASGGGFSLALAADIRIAAPDVRMNASFIKLGVSGCELGTSFYLPRTVGVSVANEMMMTGRFVEAERALATGLVSAVVDGDELDNAGRAMAEDMLKASKIGLRMTKATVERVGRVGDLDAAMDMEMQTQNECLIHPDFRAAIMAFKSGGKA